MRKNISKRGFTLIEIVVSLAIFAIISVGFYSLFTIVFINTYNTSEITEATFLAQRELEDEISITKETILTGTESEMSDLSDKYGLDVVLFDGDEERTVAGYHLVYEGEKGVTLESFVSKNRADPIPVPVLNPFTIAAYADENGVTYEKKYPTIDMNELTLTVDGELVVSNPGILLRYVYYWYISDEVNYSPYVEPVFPDNYALIPGETTNTLSELPEEFAGRYIKLVVTPVASKGKLGDSVVSNTIYVSQFNINENLILRLDASYINPDESDQVSVSGLEFYIKRWLAVYPEDMRNNESSNSQPLLESFTDIRETSGNRVNTITSNNGNTKTIVTGSDSNLNNILNSTVYLTMKLSSDLDDTVEILQTEDYDGDGFWLRFNKNNNRLIIRHYINSNNNQVVVDFNDVPLKNGSWLFIKLDIWNDKVAIDINGTASSQLSYSTTRTYDITPLTIRVNDKINIGDILIYEARHTDADRDEVYAYLNAKYYPED